VATVEVKGVVKRFQRVTALAGLDLTLNQGVIYGLMGPNGSGKSTLLKSVAGLLYPTAGTVLIDGEPPGVRSKAKVAYLPEIDYLYGFMSVRSIMDYYRSVFPGWREDKAKELLQFMNLREEAKVSHLSKGMRARLKILLTMAREAEVLLLDEPLSGIDPPSRSRVVGAIISQFRTDNQTVVMSTHDVSDAESIFDEVIFLKDGKIALQGQADLLREERGKSMKELFEEVYE